MTQEELQFYYTHYMEYKVGDNQFECPICHKVFSIMGFKQHIRKEHYNKDNNISNSGGYNGHYNDEQFKEKISLSSKAFQEEKNTVLYGEMKKFRVQCATCGDWFEVEEREKQFPKKQRYFCSLKCAHQYSGHQADPKKISEGVIRTLKESGKYKGVKIGKKKIYTRRQTYTKHCPVCNEDFQTFDKDKKCCSASCSKQYRDAISFNLKIQNASELEREKLRLKKYRQQCQFKFGIRNYPDEFDFKLIEEHGWYSAKNRGNNMGGVSRDHMYSVKQGFLNNIDPKIISHPANCRLVLQRDNASKYDSCSITLEELLQRIKAWNEKYPPLQHSIEVV